MSNVGATNQTLKYLDRLKPLVSVDAGGNIQWTPSLVDYNKDVFHRGKVVTNDEFNALFTKQAYQGNYISDSLNTILKEYLPLAVYRNFTSSFNLLPSFIKLFTAEEWGEINEEGLYQINIPSSVHGFVPNEEGSNLATMNIDVEMYILDSAGNFFEVQQFSVTADNTVTAYTDDNTLSGILIIKNSDKAYTLATEIIDASRINGLQTVSLTGRYTDLIDLNTEDGPNTRLTNLEDTLSAVLDGELITGEAVKSTDAINSEYAKNLLSSGTIQNIPVSNIFETGSSHVKNATNTTTALNNIPLVNIFEADGKTIREATHAQRADYADESAHTINADNANNAVKATNSDYATNANYANSAGTVNDVYYQEFWLGADLYFGQSADPADRVLQVENWDILAKGVWFGNYWMGNLIIRSLYKSNAGNTYDVRSFTLHNLHSKAGNWLQLMSVGIAARTVPAQHTHWDATALMVPLVTDANGYDAIIYHNNGNSTVTFVTEDPAKDWRIDWGHTHCSQVTITNVILRRV